MDNSSARRVLREVLRSSIPKREDNQCDSDSEVAKCEFLVVPSLQPIKEALRCQE